MMYTQQPPEEAAKVIKEYVQKHSGITDHSYNLRKWIVSPFYNDDHGNKSSVGGFVITLSGSPAKFVFFIYLNGTLVQHMMWIHFGSKGVISETTTRVRSALKLLVEANGFTYTDHSTEKHY